MRWGPKEKRLAVWETGARYQMFHALALLAVAILAEKQDKPVQGTTLAFNLGTLLFSFSLYGLALTGWRWLGMVTPLGGLALLAGWLLLFRSAFTR